MSKPVQIQLVTKNNSTHGVWFFVIKFIIVQFKAINNQAKACNVKIIIKYKIKVAIKDN